MSHAEEMLAFLRTIKCGECGGNQWHAEGGKWTCLCGRYMTESDVSTRSEGSSSEPTQA